MRGSWLFLQQPAACSLHAAATHGGGGGGSDLSIPDGNAAGAAVCGEGSEKAERQRVQGNEGVCGRGGKGNARCVAIAWGVSESVRACCRSQGGTRT